MKSKISTLIISLFIIITSYSQSDNAIHFQSKSLIVQANINTFSWDSFPENTKYQTGFFGYIQFNEIPSQTIQENFKNSGLLLLEYIPNKTYLFYFPKKISISYLRSKGVIAIFPIENEYKLSLNLQDKSFGEWATNGDNIKLSLTYYDFIPKNHVKNNLLKSDVKIIRENEFFPNLIIEINKNKIDELASLVFVKWVEQIAPPSIKEDTRGRSLHRVNAVNTSYTAGRQYTGDGIGVMVRDDGSVGPHIDFQGRITNIITSTGGNHGDGVAGIMTGAGNLNPYMKGMAPGASLYVVDYVPDFLDNETNILINNGSVQITNSSYGNGCNAGYTSISQTVDTQINNNLNLLHVYSAGNSGGSDCGYGAGSGWGNITGGHKQGKNVIATANIYYDGSLVGSSSRGPAYDGRIKPDIAANGQNQMSTDHNNTYRSFGGTSGAAPNIAGIASVLYEAYQQNNGGNLPESALIKAIMLNTTNDLGNVGPDYKYGWGHINALRAAILIEDNRFLNDVVSQGNNNNHTIAIPAGTKEVRFMLYWNDPAASPSSATALVNDLDLVVTNPINATLLPWILDPTPNATTLNNPATNGVDHLNNMEQVLVENPIPGNYTINVTGFNVPFGPQNYFIVYEIISDDITLIYPIGGESFTPNDTEVIHWDAKNDATNVLLEYSTNNGVNWHIIATVPSSNRLYEWNVPTTISGTCLVKVTKGISSDQSHVVFSIAPVVTGVNLTQVCPDTMIVTCNAVANAVSYELYVLGNKYMDLVATSTTNTISLSITNYQDEVWYAMKAIGADGWQSQRTIAKYHAGGLYNCDLDNDLELTAILNPISGVSCGGNSEIVSVTIANVGVNNQQNFTISYQLNSEPIVQEVYVNTLNNGFTVNFDFTQPITLVPQTNYILRVWITLVGDENAQNDEKTISFLNMSNITAPWLDDVETHLPTTSSDIQNCWLSTPNNNDNIFRWDISSDGTTVSSNTGPNTANSGDQYFYIEASDPASQGDVAELITPMVDITNLNTPQLSFYYHMYGVAINSLHIDVFNNGNWYEDEIVINGEQQNFEASPWQEQTLVLAAYTGEVRVRFRAIMGSDYQGDISIDDIAILEAPTCPKPTSLNAVFITETAIDVSWLAGNTEANWELEYGLMGFTQGQGTTIQTTTNSYSITGLTSGVSYDVYLRANCGLNIGDDDSVWIGPVTYTTALDFCNGAPFVDSGGINNNYVNNENKVTTIFPSS